MMKDYVLWIFESFVKSNEGIGSLIDDIRNRLLEADITETTSGDLVKDVISFLNENYCHTPSLEELAQRFCVSKYYLCHCFKEYTKTTIHSYIQMKKINKAKELLKAGTLPQQVSEECGFSTFSYG